MNDIYQYLIAAKTLVDGVANNKVANFAYTQTAYTEDIVDGVTEYSYGNDQNIPLGSHTDLEQNVRDKGIRSQAASLPRNAINHFFGRVSYNLNKITDTLNSFIAQITRALTQNGSFYSALAEYRQYDTCTILVTEDGVDLLKTFLRTSSVPEVIQGVIPISDGVINTEHWKLMYSTDTVTQVTTDSSTKIASTELVDNKIEAYSSLVNAVLATKAPMNHASENTTYGVATTSEYGHIKLANALANETSTVPTSAILYAVNNALTNALSEKVNSENPTFTGVLSADRAQIANTFIDYGVYLNEQDGFLIKTDIPPTVNVMTHLEFTMNAYATGRPCIGIVQCYPFASSSAIIESKYSAMGGAPAYCQIFFTNGVLCFWIPKTGNFQTLHPVLHTAYGSYKIVSTTAEALPASRDRAVRANVNLSMERKSQYISDFNAISPSMLNVGETITFNSTYRPANMPPGGPDFYTGFISYQLVDSGGYLTVLAFGSTGSDNFWFRRQTAGVWGSWAKIWNSGNLDVDTIKQAVTGIQVLTADPSSPANGTIWLRSNV